MDAAPEPPVVPELLLSLSFPGTAEPGIQPPGPKADPQIWGVHARNVAGGHRSHLWHDSGTDGCLCCSPRSKQELGAVPRLEQAAEGCVPGGVAYP